MSAPASSPIHAEQPFSGERPHRARTPALVPHLARQPGPESSRASGPGQRPTAPWAAASSPTRAEQPFSGERPHRARTPALIPHLPRQPGPESRRASAPDQQPTAPCVSASSPTHAEQPFSGERPHEALTPAPLSRTSPGNPARNQAAPAARASGRPPPGRPLLHRPAPNCRSAERGPIKRSPRLPAAAPRGRPLALPVGQGVGIRGAIRSEVRTERTLSRSAMRPLAARTLCGPVLYGGAHLHTISLADFWIAGPGWRKRIPRTPKRGKAQAFPRSSS